MSAFIDLRELEFWELIVLNNRIMFNLSNYKLWNIFKKTNRGSGIKKPVTLKLRLLFSFICEPFPPTVRFLKLHSLPPTALVSFPGSGNSWLRWGSMVTVHGEDDILLPRYLVETSSGVFTGSFYKEKIMATSGLYGELGTNFNKLHYLS